MSQNKIGIPRITIDLSEETIFHVAAEKALALAKLTASTITLTFENAVVMVTEEMSLGKIREEWTFGWKQE